MKSIKTAVRISFIFILAMPFSSMSGEKDIIKEWIREDMEGDTIKHLEELKARRDKEKVEENKATILELYREARELLKFKRYDEARERYENILKLNPNEFKAKEYIATIDEIKKLAQENEMKRAMTAKAREDKAKFTQLSRDGAGLYRNRQYKEAIEKWEEALKYDQDDTALREWINRARLRETEEGEREIIFEKELEEKAALAAIDEAYIPKSRKARGLEEIEEEEKITKEEERRRQIEEMLEKIEIGELHLKDVDLRRIVNELSSRTKVTILVDWTAIGEAGTSPASEPTPEPAAEGETAEIAVEPREIKTLHLDLDIYTPMPLKSLLDYLMKLTRLKYRVEEHAVLISTPEALEKEGMVVKVYKLKYGMTKIRSVTLKPLGAEK